MSCDVGDEYPDVSREKLQRAQKEHRCCACKETIRRGDIYRYVMIIFEGEPESWKYCLRCAAMFDAVNRALPGDQAPDPNLDCGHTWEELHGECPPEIERLAFLTADEAQKELAAR